MTTARLAAVFMMKLPAKVGVLLLDLLAAVLVLYSVSLIFLSNFNMGNLMVWLLTACVAGYAVFRGETLCGFLDTDAALGADLLLGFAPQASYVLPDGSGGTVTVQLHTAKASLSPVRNGGETAVGIAVRVRAGVTESSGADPADAEMLARLEDGLSRAVAAQIEAAAEASKALDADFLELWRVLPEVKDEGVLASLRILVQTESVLERSYDIYGSAHGKEEREHG